MHFRSRSQALARRLGVNTSATNPVPSTYKSDRSAQDIDLSEPLPRRPQPPSEEPGIYDAGQAALVWLRALVTAYRKLLLVCAIGAPIAALAVSFIVTPRFTSEATFIPEQRSGMGALGNAALLGLASQFGVSLGGATAQGPQFYVEVLRGREIRTRLLQARFPRPAAGDSATLLDILQVTGKTPPLRLRAGLKLLDKRLGAEVDPRTSIVHLAFDAPDPLLSQEVLTRAIRELNDFNLERRQTQAHLRRQFIDTRVDDMQRSLQQAEDDLQQFYEHNRTWETSPALKLEEQRIRRDISLKDDILGTLRHEQEAARIDEVNDAPLISVIDPPSYPAVRSYPKRVTWMVVSFFLGIFGALTLAGVLDAMSKHRRVIPDRR